MTTTSKQALGAYGERVAERRLVEAGMAVLDRNWRCDQGEIDLVARDGNVLVVCEVKTRSSLACGTPHEAITDTKLERLRRLGLAWATAHHLSPSEVRVDLVAVLQDGHGAAVVDHVRGIG